MSYRYFRRMLQRKKMRGDASTPKRMPAGDIGSAGDSNEVSLHPAHSDISAYSGQQLFLLKPKKTMDEQTA